MRFHVANRSSATAAALSCAPQLDAFGLLADELGLETGAAEEEDFGDLCPS